MKNKTKYFLEQYELFEKERRETIARGEKFINANHHDIIENILTVTKSAQGGLTVKFNRRAGKWMTIDFKAPGSVGDLAPVVGIFGDLLSASKSAKLLDRFFSRDHDVSAANDVIEKACLDAVFQELKSLVEMLMLEGIVSAQRCRFEGDFDRAGYVTEFFKDRKFVKYIEMDDLENVLSIGQVSLIKGPLSSGGWHKVEELEKAFDQWFDELSHISFWLMEDVGEDRQAVGAMWSIYNKLNGVDSSAQLMSDSQMEVAKRFLQEYQVRSEIKAAFIKFMTARVSPGRYPFIDRCLLSPLREIGLRLQEHKK